ncbi:MAG: macro domain-containing protein [Candidatus Cloacimonetes bacterium]|nr:macro domain-containing protein [Candidatus Cloacimonadota bacterium]
MRLGSAHKTEAGRLDYKAIIHVAGINFLWFATKYSIEKSIDSALNIARSNNYKSIAFPLIGAGSGNRGLSFSKEIMTNKFKDIESDILVKLVIFKES